MSKSSQTSAIDEKKKEKKPESNNFVSNITSFAITSIVVFLIIIGYFGISGYILYACKLAQSNILPTDMKCFPYEDIKPDIEPIETNIFTTFTDPQLSMKMKFPYNEYNSKNKILDMFREYKKEPNSHFLANYLISIMESLIHFNYASFNIILNMMNGLPEVLLVFLGPIIFGIFSSFIFLLDHLYAIYLWFSGMSWFFKTNINKTDSGAPKWSDVSIFSPFNFFCAFWLAILFIVIFFFGLPFISFIVLLAITWCSFSCLTYKAEMYNKSITALTIIQDILKYYKVSIMGIFSLFVIISAFSKLGTISGVFSIITLIFIYYGFIAIDMFKPINKEELSVVTSYNQAKKTCSNKDVPKDKHGLIYNMVFGQKGGGNITKELKRLSKK